MADSQQPIDEGSSNPVEASRDPAYDALRVLATLGVVAIHVFGPTAANDDIHGSATWWSAQAIAVGSVFAVPTFVMLAGVFGLDDRAHRAGAAVYVNRRAARILPALLLWHAVYLIGVRGLVLGERLSPRQMVAEVYETTAYPHLYFLWLIAGLYVVAPLLHAFLKGGPLGRSLLVGGTALVASVLVVTLPHLAGFRESSPPVDLNALTFWIPYVGYFVVGYALAHVRVSLRWACVVSCVGIAAGAVTVWQSSSGSDLAWLNAVSPVEHFGVIVVIFSASVFVAVPRLVRALAPGAAMGRVLTRLADATFGVYLVHLILLLVVDRIFDGYHRHASASEAFIAYAITVVSSFAMVMLVKRWRAIARFV